jgi:histidinol-phosphate aminotransferase
MLKYDINDLIRPEIQQLSAYKVADASGLIKLDAMENPYTWPRELIQVWSEGLHSIQLNRYPDPTAWALKQQLRDLLHLPADLAISLGNGSDELIQILAMLLNKPQAVMLAPEPSFVMYKQIANTLGMKYVAVPLLPENFKLDIFAILEAIDNHQPALIMLAYPNNPTANLFSPLDIESIIENSPGLVVVDEAYTAFSQHSFMPKIQQYPNLLVMGTLSKLGLAGLRLGYVVGTDEWIQVIEKIRLPYNINSLSQYSADFALQNYAMFDQQVQNIIQQRSYLLQQLSTITGITVWPSAANFILFRVKNATAVHTALQQHGILIKCLHGGHPLLQDCLRVTVGTENENLAFLQAMREILAVNS